MNIASWIILIIVAAWIFVAVKCAFFGGFSKKRSSCCGGGDKDDEYKITTACSGCDKGSCSGCPSEASRRNVPMPIIHETK